MQIWKKSIPAEGVESAKALRWGQKPTRLAAAGWSDLGGGGGGGCESCDEDIGSHSE